MRCGESGCSGTLPEGGGGLPSASRCRVPSRYRACTHAQLLLHQWNQKEQCAKSEIPAKSAISAIYIRYRICSVPGEGQAQRPHLKNGGKAPALAAGIEGVAKSADALLCLSMCVPEPWRWAVAGPAAA